MNCENVKLLIEEFYDGELNYELKNRVAEHIAGCNFCCREFESVSDLDKLLEKSFVPAPSAILDESLLQAFTQKQGRNVKSAPVWRQIIFGSVSLPKPVLAMSLILILFALIGANIIGRNSSIPADISTSLPNTSVPSETTGQTKIVEVPVTKIVEVPVIKERIVNRVIYVNSQRNAVSQNKICENSSGQSDSSLNNFVAKNKQFTQTSLKGFQPFSEFTMKILSEEKPNEK